MPLVSGAAAVSRLRYCDSSTSAPGGARLIPETSTSRAAGREVPSSRSLPGAASDSPESGIGAAAVLCSSVGIVSPTSPSVR